MLHVQLPFDVLGIIFHDYAEHETIDHPLETLLLVCRSWNEAAIGHCTLWNHLKIYIGHKPASKVWGARLPLRLARCGPTIPLYIDTRNVVPYIASRRNPGIYSVPIPCTECYNGGDSEACFMAASTGIERSWQLLRGPNGELCARWRYFQFDPCCGDTSFELARTLSYNTPNLETLILRNVIPLPNAFAGIHPLPDTESLKAITVVNCKLPFLPKLDGILQATIGWEDEEECQVLETFQLSSAVKLQQLVLLLPPYKDAILPPRLPNLTSLEIIGSHLPSNIYQCETLRLLELKIYLTQLADLSSLFTSRVVHPETLRRVTITWYLTMCFHVYFDLGRILQSLSHLDSIRSQGQMLSLIVRILSIAKGTSKGLMCGKHLFNEGKKARIDFEGDEDVGWFETLASNWNLIPPSLPESQWFYRCRGPCGTILLTTASSTATGVYN